MVVVGGGRFGGATSHEACIKFVLSNMLRRRWNIRKHIRYAFSLFDFLIIIEEDDETVIPATTDWPSQSYIDSFRTRYVTETCITS